MTTPWAAMLAEATAAGLAPEAFWRLSLKEWRMLHDRPGATPPGWGDLKRDDLQRMMEAWPDER